MKKRIILVQIYHNGLKDFLVATSCLIYGRTIYLSPTEKAVAIKSRDFYKNFHFLFRGILNVKDDYLGSSSGHAAILNTRSSIGSRTCHEN